MSSEKEMWELSDEELEAAFRAAKADGHTADEVEDRIEEEIIEDSLEQPELQDSDDDTETDELDEIETEEESQETEVVAEEETTEVEEDKPAEVPVEADKKVQPAQDKDDVLTFKANGQEYKFTTAEVKEQFGKVFGQAMDYTKKMQQIKPWRKTIDAIEQANLGQDDVNLMIDVLKGDKDAIATVLKRTGVDALDLDLDNNKYVAKDYGRNDTELSIKDIVDEISVDREYAITHNVLEKQWDDKSRRAFVEDPNLIRLLHIDVKNGMFDKISPMAQKLKVYNGGKQSDFEYYMSAAQQYSAEQSAHEASIRASEAEASAQASKAAEMVKLNEVKARQEKQVVTQESAAKRKAAATTRKVVGTKKSTDFLNDSDEDFDEWYSKLKDSQ